MEVLFGQHEALTGRDDERRQLGARLVADEYERRSRVLGAKDFDRYQNVLHAELARLLDGTGVEPLGGLELIYELTPRGSADEDKVTEFSNLLRCPHPRECMALSRLYSGWALPHPAQFEPFGQTLGE